MPSGTRVNGLPVLPLPPARTDRMLVGRGGIAHRRDLSGMHGGLSLRSPVAKPQASDFPLWINQGTATLADVGDALALAQDDSITTDQFRVRVRSLPTGDWDVQIGAQRLWGAWRYQTGGLVLRESGTGKLEVLAFGYGENDAGLVAARYASPTAFSGERRGSWEFHEIGWFRARKYNGQFLWLFSPDGLSWNPFLDPRSLNDHFNVAPDQWGFFINPINVDTPPHAQRLDVFHWSEETNTDIYPFPAYPNRFGRGDRRALITQTTDTAWTGFAFSDLINGNAGSNAFQFVAGQSGRHITFQFPDGRIIDQARWFQDVSGSHGTWEWQASNNGTSWSTISTGFTLDGVSAGTNIGDLSANTASYIYYRMQQTAGVTSATPWPREIEFKILSD